MDVVGSEIGQKMRSAIKAKLTELGCYVDDELPDYVMVMVANKRTREQMEDDLQLFLGDNTELFVNWLHQVLKKLQEVTVTTPLKTIETEKSKEKPKEKKSKDKKDKGKVKKPDSVKKTKKKDKAKSHRKKEDRKLHKSKKKSKHHEMIHPNVPPLLMNIEKESEPSITDVFAGQILKNHGINLDISKEDKQVDCKPIIKEIKRPILPIIDPATISTQPEPIEINIGQPSTELSTEITILSPTDTCAVDVAPRQEQIKEINEIEAKIQGLKRKLAEQLDSMSDDEDFLNIRTEAEELMNDFAEDVFQEISQQAPVATPPLASRKSPSPPIQPPPKILDIPQEIPKVIPIEPPETLPQIELKLPKRSVRERLGAREEPKIPEVKEKEINKRTESPERFTPEREPDFWGKHKPAKSRLGDPPEPSKKTTIDDSTNKSDCNSKRINSRISAPESRPARMSCASVVRVRPRPRVAPASSLLMRAVADAHKSLLNIPPKQDTEPKKIKRALVLPMRRAVEAKKILISVAGGERAAGERAGGAGGAGGGDSKADEKDLRITRDIEKDDYALSSITKQIVNTEYVSRRNERTSSRRDDTLIIETINIHNPTVDKDKDTQFIVTMEGFNPNAFLTKKLLSEGLLNDGEEIKDKPAPKSVLKTLDKPEESETVAKSKKIDEPKEKEETIIENISEDSNKNIKDVNSATNTNIQKKRLSDTSEESDTQVIIKQEEKEICKSKEVPTAEEEDPPVKKRKASPIVFNAKKKEIVEKETEKKKERERTESVSSDNNVTVATTTSTHKYDSLPPLSQAERKPVWCRSFPLCRYGATCAFQHPRCKFAASCTRRGCAYAHGPGRNARLAPPVLASHVVPAANYKSISAVVLPSVCKYYPQCVNPGCHYYHPKPCRYGKACVNKLECNFYHIDVPGGHWRHPV